MHGGKKVKSVISGDMCLGNDTSHDGGGRAAVMQTLCRKSPKGFSGSLKRRRETVSVFVYMSFSAAAESAEPLAVGIAVVGFQHRDENSLHHPVTRLDMYSIFLP